jgi:TPR repeat protein
LSVREYARLHHGWKCLWQGKGVEADAVRAASYFAQACEGGEMTGCNNLGLAFVPGKGVAKDAVRANVLFEQACDKGASGSFWRGAISAG